jgi:predicted oxidoreductase
VDGLKEIRRLPSSMNTRTSSVRSQAVPTLIEVTGASGVGSSQTWSTHPRVHPKNHLGPIEQGPFSAFKMVPGDLGTKGGLVTDADGTPIAGLYAAGNTSAPVMGRTYPGPGSTIAPATVFAYRAAIHASGRAA